MDLIAEHLSSRPKVFPRYDHTRRLKQKREGLLVRSELFFVSGTKFRRETDSIPRIINISREQAGVKLMA